MSSIGHAKLAAQSGGGHACGMVSQAHGLWIGNGTQQIADKAVEFGVGDEMRGLLLPKRSAQNTRQAEQRRISAGQAVRSMVSTDQLTLNAKCRSLQRDEIDFFESRAIHGL